LLGLLIVAAELFIVYAVSLKLFVSDSYLAEMTSPFLAILLSYVGSAVYNFVTERKQKVMIKNMFSHYVNRDVVNELVDNPEKLQLTGVRRQMTVIFTDIENFTSLAERMPAEELVAILNEYLNEMTAIIFKNLGTVDKYEGDAVMAFWGAPIPHEDHALLACKTAIEMQVSILAKRPADSLSTFVSALIPET
jgi:adenylate cyclase